MTHSTLQAVEQPSPESTDPLHDLIRRGARQLIATAVNAELESMLKSYAHQRDGQGRRAVVRNGYLPERSIQTGVGEVAVQVPLGRYIEKDRIGLAGGINLYSYGNAHPVDKLDPSGESSGRLRLCTDHVFRILTNIKKRYCPGRGSSYQAKSCNFLMKCDELQRNAAAFDLCARARAQIHNRCFRDLDPGHVTEVQNALNGANNCRKIYAEKCVDSEICDDRCVEILRKSAETVGKAIIIIGAAVASCVFAS